MIRSSIAIRIQRGNMKLRMCGYSDSGEQGIGVHAMEMSLSHHRMRLDAIKYYRMPSNTATAASITPIPCNHQHLIAHPSIPLLSFKVKASACSFHLCSIPSLQQTPQSTQPDSHSAPTNPRVSFSCYFGVSGRIRPKQSVSVQQQPSQNTQLQASLSISHHPLSHPSTTVPEYRTPKCTSYLHCIPLVLVVSFHLPLNIAASIYPAW